MTANPTNVTAGSTTAVSGVCFTPNQSHTITLTSDPVSLGTVTTDANGSFAATVTIPASTTNGAHTITVAATRSASVQIQVTGGVAAAVTTTTAGTTTPAATGAATVPVAVAGLALLTFGFWLKQSGRGPWRVRPAGVSKIASAFDGTDPRLDRSPRKRGRES